MKLGFLEYLVCPLCQSDLKADLSEPEPDGEYLSGTLICTNDDCSKEFPIVNGVPRMVVVSQESGGAAETFGFEWEQHGKKNLEGTTVFGRTQDQDMAYFKKAFQLDTCSISKAVVLDGGCGSGQLTEGISKLLGAKTVIGVDVNYAIEYPFKRCRYLENVHIVQADITALPFKVGQFDLVWSNGVIHHAPDTPKSFGCLAKLVKTGGKLYVWVYERRWNPFRFTKDVLSAIGIRRMPLKALFVFVKMVKVPSYVLLSIYRAIRWLPFLRPKTTAGKSTTRARSLKEIELTWFDALSPKYDNRYTEEEVKEWFISSGFKDLICYEHKVGVCGIKK